MKPIGKIVNSPAEVRRAAKKKPRFSFQRVSPAMLGRFQR
jgi:hypothetical protein